MTTIPASEFKAKCLALMDLVAQTCETTLAWRHVLSRQDASR